MPVKQYMISLYNRNTTQRYRFAICEACSAYETRTAVCSQCSLL